MPILTWPLRRKAACHNYIYIETLDLGIQCVQGRLLACWSISVPATSAREHAALSACQRTLAPVPEHASSRSEQGRGLPGNVVREFEDCLKCGRLDQRFLQARSESCHREKLVAFSCKHPGICPSCGARRMVDSAVHLVDKVLPKGPIRQCW